MSLDFYLEELRPVTMFEANITHNLTQMAEKAGLYKFLWRPEEIPITAARQLIDPLRVGLEQLGADPEYFKQFNDPDGWGTYEHFVSCVKKCLAACELHPEADVRTSR